MGIIDIHTHMLYGVDDGAEDMEMSLALMGMDYEQGVSGIFCTNHSYDMEVYYREYHRRFEKLVKAAADRYPGLSLYKGCEILCYRDEMAEIVGNIKDDIFPTMNGTNYVLLEFEPYGTEGTEEMSYCANYALDAGYTPIIAHVERYKTIYDDPLTDVIRLRELGCLAQINLYSVEQDRGNASGEARRELANLFLKNRLIDFVGTDAHRTDYKSPEAAVGAAAIREKYGVEYAERVLYKNAENALRVSTSVGTKHL